MPFPEKSVIDVLLPGSAVADAGTRKLVESGRGGLSAILGDDDVRQRLFAGKIDWDRIFVAKVDGKTVGFLAFQWRGRGPYVVNWGDFRREFGFYSGSWRWLANAFLDARTHHCGFYIYGLKVLPAARRRGVASALVNAAEIHALALGAEELELDVFEHNERALLFYSALGFVTKSSRNMSWLKRWLGFSAVFRLTKSLPAQA